MLVNLMRLGVMEWTSPPQTDSIRCDAAVAAASHHPRHAVTLFSPRTTSPPLRRASGGRSGTWPDEVSLQADDPLDDLLLGILGRPDGTKKQYEKHMSTKCNQLSEGVVLWDVIDESVMHFEIWAVWWSSRVTAHFQTLAVIKDGRNRSRMLNKRKPRRFLPEYKAFTMPAWLMMASSIWRQRQHLKKSFHPKGQQFTDSTPWTRPRLIELSNVPKNNLLGHLDACLEVEP